ncbi:MAG: thrombospondin type 3 repeat-containing protein [bacterium]|nr:thrombospondin type 3 repeat-containing protein [bacterium]
MKLKILFLSFIIFSATLTVNAQEIDQNLIISAYRYYKDIENISINVPTVVEVPFANEFIERSEFAVLDKTTNSFEPYFLKQELISKTPVSISSNPNTDTVDQMNDNNIQTYADFPLPNNIQGQTQITLSYMSPITSSILTALLDSNVALPSSVEIRAFVNGQNRIVVANQRMDQQTVRFPQTTSNKWIITFIFSQPLRISELRLNQEQIAGFNTYDVRFLAQPAHSYRVYFNPDRTAIAPVGEIGNLAFTKDIFIMPVILSQNNSNYIIADVDSDGVADIRDNCVFVSNSDQQDVNNNNRGDVCDDFDQDGIINSKDNCPNNPNQYQEDIDSDGIGDVCDKEESRITERHAWIPWVGVGFASIVLITLFVLTARSKK